MSTLSLIEIILVISKGIIRRRGRVCVAPGRQDSVSADGPMCDTHMTTLGAVYTSLVE